jgi:hypothetical protein
MKTFRLVTVLLLATSLTFGGQLASKDKTSKVKAYVDKYKSNITLTDSQIVKITKCCDDYYTQIENNQLIPDETVRMNALIDIQKAFQNAKDSILSPEQRIYQKNKVDDRKTKLVNKYK